MVNGGRYGGIIQPFNEFIVMPYKAESIFEAVQMGVRLFAALSDVLERHAGFPPKVARSYGYVAPSEDPKIVLSLMQEAVEACGYAERVAYALDCASSEMYDSTTATYYLKGQRVSADDLISYVKRLTEEFNLVFIEDLLDENDWNGYARAVKEISRAIILGDDLIATNLKSVSNEPSPRELSMGLSSSPTRPRRSRGTENLRVCSRPWPDRGPFRALRRSSGRCGHGLVSRAWGSLQKNGAPRSGERMRS